MHELTNGIGNAYPFQGRIQDFKLRTMIYKSLQRKLKIEQHEPHKYWGELILRKQGRIQIGKNMIFFA
jgi:hypothetical protein